eukprot:5782355-Heterocapsa_arctica.AAC.1
MAPLTFENASFSILTESPAGPASPMATGATWPASAIADAAAAMADAPLTSASAARTFSSMLATSRTFPSHLTK